MEYLSEGTGFQYKYGLDMASDLSNFSKKSKSKLFVGPMIYIGTQDSVLEEINISPIPGLAGKRVKISLSLLRVPSDVFQLLRDGDLPLLSNGLSNID